MKWEKKVSRDSQMVKHLCFFRSSQPWNITVLLLLTSLLIIIFLGFLGSIRFFFVFLISSSVLILSTILFTTFSKLFIIQNPSEINQDVLILEDDDHDHDHDHVVEETELKNRTAPPQKSAEVEDQDEDIMSSDQNIVSETTAADSEEVEYWLSLEDKDNETDQVRQRNSAVCSDDGSISDEESLIEIALPSGHYIKEDHDHDFDKDYVHDEKPAVVMFNDLQQKIMAVDLFSDCNNIFKQRSLMELLAEINEMNEEENLIEIDISMGSIKCSRFEIEA